jgi:hypothetical protein
MGLEPTTLGTTNRCSNQLSYNLHDLTKKIGVQIYFLFKKLAIIFLMDTFSHSYNL